ncbi:PLCXc domain-containing protein [Caerostris darwini]|uniref:PLCXc domain-containing protein n=1 Tax=Caerostris darwini TaxID=1538125 RepID=A0AAV4TEB4_9ARAC|nr:PLCXc domain-containing protein [Caerostris darwini]
MARSSPFVGLYAHDPELDPTNHLVLRKPFACPNGRFETVVSLPYVNFDAKHNVSRCLGFWAAYLEAGRLVHSNCLRTHPDWMYNMKETIGNKTLKCLMIPGTHDSGCYRRYDPYKDTIFDKYVYTQDEPVFNQLVYGIRYIDLRIWHEGASKRASSIWITHDVFHVGLPFLKDVLHQVKDFVLATKEIVIIDIHRKLTGFFISGKLETWQHREVIELGKEIFGNLLIDSKYSSKPLDFFWESNKRVLFAYQGHGEPHIDGFAASNVRHWWTDTQSIPVLHKYLTNNSCEFKYGLTATNAVLTPNIWHSRRNLSNKANSEIDVWFRNELSCANIIITDYFLGNNVIEISMQTNKNRTHCAYKIRPSIFIN